MLRTRAFSGKIGTLRSHQASVRIDAAKALRLLLVIGSFRCGELVHNSG
jgi:hypothetical protein